MLTTLPRKLLIVIAVAVTTTVLFYSKPFQETQVDLPVTAETFSQVLNIRIQEKLPSGCFEAEVIAGSLGEWLQESARSRGLELQIQSSTWQKAEVALTGVDLEDLVEWLATIAVENGVGMGGIQILNEGDGVRVSRLVLVR